MTGVEETIDELGTGLTDARLRIEATRKAMRAPLDRLEGGCPPDRNVQLAPDLPPKADLTRLFITADQPREDTDTPADD